MSPIHPKGDGFTSSVHQLLEIANGPFVFQISCDGEFIKIARKGTPGASSFFLIPIAAWDEVVNFVYTETKRRSGQNAYE